MADANQPMYDAINQARLQYPWLKRFGKIALTKGDGPYESESYMPDAKDNPSPGNYTIQLRSQKQKSNPQGWADLIGREGIDWLARSDPTYQAVAQHFIASMTPEQLAHSRQRFKNEGGKGNFDDWMREAEVQEYIGGFLTPKAASGWTGPRGEGKYTPEQTEMLHRLRAYLSQ